MDPPQEDMNYKEFVSVATTSIPKELEDTPTFSALTSILNSLGYVLAASTALKKIEGKCLGAIKAGDKESLQEQTSNYKNIVENVISHGKQLSETAGKAEHELSKKEFFSLGIIEKGLNIWKKDGLSPDIYKIFVSGGLTDENLSNLRKLIDNPYYKIEILRPVTTFKTLIDTTMKLIDEIKIKKPPEL